MKIQNCLLFFSLACLLVCCHSSDEETNVTYNTQGYVFDEKEHLLQDPSKSELPKSSQEMTSLSINASPIPTSNLNPIASPKRSRSEFIFSCLNICTVIALFSFVEAAIHQCPPISRHEKCYIDLDLVSIFTSYVIVQLFINLYRYSTARFDGRSIFDIGLSIIVPLTLQNVFAFLPLSESHSIYDGISFAIELTFGLFLSLSLFFSICGGICSYASLRGSCLWMGRIMNISAVVFLIIGICKAASISIYPSIDSIESIVSSSSDSIFDDDSNDQLIEIKDKSPDNPKPLLADSSAKAPSVLYKSIAIFDAVNTVLSVSFIGMIFKLTGPSGHDHYDSCEPDPEVNLILKIYSAVHLILLPFRFGTMYRDGLGLAKTALFNLFRSGIVVLVLWGYFEKQCNMYYVVMAAILVTSNSLMELGYFNVLKN